MNTKRCPICGGDMMSEDTATILGMCKSILAAIREGNVPTLYHISQIPGCREFESRYEKDQKEIAALRARCEAAERERDHWKANHDNQVSIKAIILDRPDLVDRAARVIGLIEQRDAAQAEVARLRMIVDDVKRHTSECQDGVGKFINDRIAEFEKLGGKEKP